MRHFPKNVMKEISYKHNECWSQISWESKGTPPNESLEQYQIRVFLRRFHPWACRTVICKLQPSLLDCTPDRWKTSRHHGRWWNWFGLMILQIIQHRRRMHGSWLWRTGPVWMLSLALQELVWSHSFRDAVLHILPDHWDWLGRLPPLQASSWLHERFEPCWFPLIRAY